MPVEGIASARESSMYSRNHEQVVALQKLFYELTRTDRPDEEAAAFFRAVVFTCSTIRTDQAWPYVETLNSYMTPSERDQIRSNMNRNDKDKNGFRTGRDRNALRLETVKAWWQARKGEVVVRSAGRAGSLKTCRPSSSSSTEVTPRLNAPVVQ